MDWKQVIERNREALAVIVAGLVVMVGQRDALSSPLRRSILRILRPAEAALRRLIVIVAATLSRKVGKQQDGAAEIPLPDFFSFASGDKRSVFALIDPRKRFGGMARPFGAVAPRISVPGLSDPIRQKRPDHATSAESLYRRIETLEAALNNLPRQARRLNRLMARRVKAEPGPGKVGPIRPGLPPGFRKKPRHEVDAILLDCHWLALESGFKPP